MLPCAGATVPSDMERASSNLLGALSSSSMPCRQPCCGRDTPLGGRQSAGSSFVANDTDEEEAASDSHPLLREQR